MGLSCGIVGLPNVGKTTVFQALTLSTAGERSSYMFSTTEPVPGMVDVPDSRLQEIARFFPARKIVPAHMQVTDIPALVAGSSTGHGMGIGFLGAIKESDVLLHVVRCFENPAVPHVSGDLDPAVDAEIVDLELAQADRQTLKRGTERVGKRAKAGDHEAQTELAAYDKAIAALEQDQVLRQVEFTPAEHAILKQLFLLTIKPMLFVANVGDDDLQGEGRHVQALRGYAARTGAEVLHLCGDLEAEFIRLEPEERQATMVEFGFTESGLARLIGRAFALLGLQTFFTHNEKEVRAWVIHRGDTAVQAAAAVHTDFARRFVRAEVYQVAELVEHGSEAALKAAGRLRLEGRDYVLQDGDVCFFLIGG